VKFLSYVTGNVHTLCQEKITRFKNDNSSYRKLEIPQSSSSSNTRLPQSSSSRHHLRDSVEIPPKTRKKTKSGNFQISHISFDT